MILCTSGLTDIHFRYLSIIAESMAYIDLSCITALMGMFGDVQLIEFKSMCYMYYDWHLICFQY